MITDQNMKTEIEKKRKILHKRNPNFATRRSEPRNQLMLGNTAPLMVILFSPICIRTETIKYYSEI